MFGESWLVASAAYRSIPILGVPKVELRQRYLLYPKKMPDLGPQKPMGKMEGFDA